MKRVITVLVFVGIFLAGCATHKIPSIMDTKSCPDIEELQLRHEEIRRLEEWTESNLNDLQQISQLAARPQ